ncbi:hypothetical protein FKM82_026735 [Ascaphus truei]
MGGQSSPGMGFQSLCSLQTLRSLPSERYKAGQGEPLQGLSPVGTVPIDQFEFPTSQQLCHHGAGSSASVSPFLWWRCLDYTS